MSYSVLGQKLKQLRRANNLTQQQAADLLGSKSKSAISMWENGVNEPGILPFLALCCAYGMPEAQAFVKALELENTAELEFAIAAYKVEQTPSTQEEPANKKPYAFCPYCGEKLE